VSPAEVVPDDPRSGGRDALEVVRARDRRQSGGCRPAERGAVLADREELHPGRRLRILGVSNIECRRADGRISSFQLDDA